MKTSRFILTATVLLAAAVTTFAQGRPSSARGQRPGKPNPPTDASAAITHLTEAYSKIAPFDADKNGQLDADEKDALAEAIANGEIKPPAHFTPPPNVTPSAEMLLTRLAMMYAHLASYDVDHNGSLSDSEQVALKADIESGKLGRPGGPRRGRPRG